MKFSRFSIYLFNLLIIILFLIDFTLCLKKKNNRNRDYDYESETEVPSRRSSGSQTDTVERNPSQKKKRTNREPLDGRGPDGRGPPGQRGRARSLPPGQAKKQQNNRDRVYEETTAYYEDERPSGSDKNKNKNKNKPTRGNSQSNNNNGNNDNNYDEDRPQTSRPNRPRPQTTTEAPIEIDIPLSEWRSLERLSHHWQNTAHTKSALSKKFIFFLERDADYQRHDACLTPENKLGSCHYVQHCPIPDVIRSFDKFLSYACFIHNRYVGICCPDDYLDEEDSYSKPSKVILQTTRRPQSQTQQSKPSRKPQNTNENNGSDYNNGICGVAENTKIIGGALADPKDWLWMAAILLKSDTKPFCGGAVITNQHILTAAHCLTDLTPDDVLIRLGAYDFSPAADPEAQDFAIEYFKIHPKYNRITNENDLAIIKLRVKTRFTESIAPICLPQRNRNYASQLAIVTGWGHTSFGGKGSAQLRQVSLPVWNNTSCDASYSVAISDYMLCAGNKNGGKDSCQGDSGGPLMLQGPNKRWMIIGVVSWGVKCGQPNYPGVYTRISKYIDWIKTNSKDIYK